MTPPHRPTAAQVVARRREIAQWDAEHEHRQKAIKDHQVSAARRDFLAPRAGIAFAAFAFLAIYSTLLMWWTPAIIFAVVASAFRLSEAQLRRPIPYPAGWEPDRPAELYISPFNRFENEDLMAMQKPEDFSAACQCPGCGAVEVHSIIQGENGKPSWARVCRGCHLCGRVWAQA